MEQILSDEAQAPVIIDRNAQEDATNWNKGCEKDIVRNQFIIPNLIKTLNKYRSTEILDVGTGTAFIAREVDKALRYRPKWTVIDVLPARISLAVKMKPIQMQMEGLVLGFDKITKVKAKYDAILLIFTLLEIEKLKVFFSTVQEVLSKDGIVCISMPNSLEDVHSAASSDATVFQSYMKDCCMLNKTDKFTGKTYPFYAHRFEYIVNGMIIAGFDMVNMSISRIENRESHFLVFQMKKADI